MRPPPLPASEYERRIARVQAELAAEKLDALIGYSSECESATCRYLAGFWPFFDFACVVVPAQGRAVLVTGGPESLEFARSFSPVADVVVNPLLVETSPPEWVPKVGGESFRTLLPRICGTPLRRIGVTNGNIVPHVVIEDLRAAAPDAELVAADEVLLRVQRIKSAAEIPLIVEAYRITEVAMRAALEAARPGALEWELEAVARSAMAAAGAEGMSYPAWVCSGPNTRLSLCRSTARAIRRNELVQYTFGAKLEGYCGNMCRPFSIGAPSASARTLMDAALEALQDAIAAIRPGVEARAVAARHRRILARRGWEGFALYGPAHGTGSSEVEGLWLSEHADFTIEPGMLFNVDIWLSDGTQGLRYEDGLLVTPTGVRELTTFRREVIIL